MSYAIQNRELAPAAYFSPKLARQYGGSVGWTEVVADAMHFAREQDAQTFIDIYLPAMVPLCTITRLEGSSNVCPSP